MDARHAREAVDLRCSVDSVPVGSVYVVAAHALGSSVRFFMWCSWQASSEDMCSGSHKRYPRSRGTAFFEPPGFIGGACTANRSFAYFARWSDGEMELA